MQHNDDVQSSPFAYFFVGRVRTYRMYTQLRARLSVQMPLLLLPPPPSLLMLMSTLACRRRRRRFLPTVLRTTTSTAASMLFWFWPHNVSVGSILCLTDRLVYWMLSILCLYVVANPLVLFHRLVPTDTSLTVQYL